MKEIIENYKKYRWFFTGSKKLVIGGKSASQNDDLLKTLKQKAKTDYTVMHTASPGSPFSVILSDKSPSKEDLKESAIFTACFSRLWRNQTKKAEIHVFKLSKLSKPRNLKAGTWKVSSKISKISVPLELALTVQSKILRAAPIQTLKSKKPLLKIIPGTINKQQMLPKIALELGEKFSQEEILQALPSGGVKIKR
jgi:hypothetical protein